MITATPESVGISSSSIVNLLQELHNSKFNMHSVLVLRHGKLVFEAYQPPYDKDVKHRLASVSKSFTAIAAGLMIDEGKLKLTDRVADFFPEYCASPPNPLLAEATIEDMLTMRDPHNITTHGHGIKANWLESWFLTPPDHPAGTIFQYNTTSTNLIAAIIERISGKKMVDYMYPRILTPLGFSEGCYCGETPDGDSFGGAAMTCTPRDLAKMAQLVMNGGIWEGRQLISKEFILKLRSAMVDNTLMGIPAEGMYGYGYFTWHLRHNGFAFFGIHGQFAIGFPDNGLLVVTTGNTTDNYCQEGDILLSQFVERVYNKLLPALSDDPLPENLASLTQLNSMTELPHPLAPGASSSVKSAVISGKTYKLHPNKSGWRTVRFEFYDNKCKLCYTNRRGDKEIELGLGFANPITFPENSTVPRQMDDDFGYDSYASGGWIHDRSLSIHIYPIRGGYVQLNAVFDDDRVTICIKPSNGFGIDYGGYMYGSV